jgi:serine phosphatase RsbU (regulator of sigma subunit)
VTATVQSWFLPPPGLHRSGPLDIVGFYRGAEKCSGDWWWYEDIGGGKLWVIVADVTGHGAGPAMLTAAVAMGLWVQTGSSGVDIVERLARVNRLVLDRCKGNATVSMTAALLDQQSGEVTVYGLGGIPALILTPDRKYRVVTARGNPLGSSPELDAGTASATLSRGERLLITTDGIIETRVKAPSEGALGFRRFLRLAHGTVAVPLEHAADRIVQEVDVVRGRLPQEDDFTFCLVERRH